MIIEWLSERYYLIPFYMLFVAGWVLLIIAGIKYHARKGVIIELGIPEYTKHESKLIKIGIFSVLLAIGALIIIDKILRQ